MTNRASTATAIAIGSSWPSLALIPLGWSALAGWILFAVLDSYDRLADIIEESTRRVERAQYERHAEGVIDGMRRGARPSPGLRGIR
jgi:hypothetical protein